MNLSFKEFEFQGWENVASSYHETFGKITTKVASILVDRARIQTRDKVLDVACGPGYVGACAFEKGAEVTGIDFSNAMIHESKTHYPEINFQVMDAESLQFDDASFDVVLISFGILHFANPKQAMQEVIRVLKPGGKFLFTIWDKPVTFDMILESVKEEGDLNISLPEGPDFFQFRDANFTREVLLQMGCHQIEVEQIEFLWELDGAEEFFRAFYEGGVRLGGILRSQKPHLTKKIILNLKQKMKIFERNGKLELPIPVLFFYAVKI